MNTRRSNNSDKLKSIMHMVEGKELEQRRVQRAKKRAVKKRRRLLLPACLVIIATYIAAALVVPLEPLRVQMDTINLPAPQGVSLPWPGYGQSAVGAVGYGLLASHGDQKPLPIASVAKVITAVAVLKVRPIGAGSHGDTITISAADVDTYNKYVAQDQSVIQVKVGEQLTEYQALQALLLPSANNMANILVVWAFGSMDNYLAFANPFTKTLGMKNTVIADASGFSPRTTSTADDLTKLAEIAMNQPAVAEIVRQSQADLPVAGTVFNVNKLVGHDGIVGIKTGNTDEAGGCYLYAVQRKLDQNHSVTVVGSIVGAPDLSHAINDALPVINETFKNFAVTTPLHANDRVGTISQPGGGSVPVLVRRGVAVVGWKNLPMKADLSSISLKSHISTGDEVGDVRLRFGTMSYDVPVMAGGTVSSHTLLWRLRHFAGRF